MLAGRVATLIIDSEKLDYISFPTAEFVRMNMDERIESVRRLDSCAGEMQAFSFAVHVATLHQHLVAHYGELRGECRLKGLKLQCFRNKDGRESDKMLMDVLHLGRMLLRFPALGKFVLLGRLDLLTCAQAYFKGFQWRHANNGWQIIEGHVNSTTLDTISKTLANECDEKRREFFQVIYGPNLPVPTLEAIPIALRAGAFEVKESSISSSLLGLFAAARLDVGVTLLLDGDVTFSTRPPQGTTVEKVGWQKRGVSIVRRRICSDSWIANQAPFGCENNAVLLESIDGVYLSLIREVDAGEEIFVHYGDEEDSCRPKIAPPPQNLSLLLEKLKCVHGINPESMG